jgi:hypothetical protein
MNISLERLNGVGTNGVGKKTLLLKIKYGLPYTTVGASSAVACVRSRCKAKSDQTRSGAGTGRGGFGHNTDRPSPVRATAGGLSP